MTTLHLSFLGFVFSTTLIRISFARDLISGIGFEAVDLEVVVLEAVVLEAIFLAVLVVVFAATEVFGAITLRVAFF